RDDDEQRKSARPHLILLGPSSPWPVSYRAASTPTTALSACARCETAFFSSGESSAAVLVSPDGTNTGPYPKPPSPRGAPVISPAQVPSPRSSVPSARTTTATAR